MHNDWNNPVNDTGQSDDAQGGLERQPAPMMIQPGYMQEEFLQRPAPGFGGGFYGPPGFHGGVGGPPVTGPHPGGAAPFIGGLASGLLTGALLYPLWTGGYPYYGYAPGYPPYYW